MKAKTIKTVEQLHEIKKQYNDEQAKYQYRVYVCSGAGCVSSNCAQIRDTVISEVEKIGMKDKVKVYETDCMGTCAVGPVMLIMPDKIFYTELTPAKTQEIVRVHLTESMIHGVIDKREGFLGRLREIEGFKSARVVRSRHLAAQFGEQRGHEYQTDEIEEKAAAE